MARVLPDLAAKLCYGASSGWIVGGAARDINPKDYDIVIPLTTWKHACLLIPRDAVVNAFGGWKCLSEGKEIDVWPSDIGELMTNKMVTHLWHPQSDARFNRQ